MVTVTATATVTVTVAVTATVMTMTVKTIRIIYVWTSSLGTVNALMRTRRARKNGLKPPGGNGFSRVRSVCSANNWSHREIIMQTVGF